MANWQSTLNVKDLWELHEDDKITIQALATQVADRLAALGPWVPDLTGIRRRRDQIVIELRELAQDDSAEVADFDDVLARLYDWADTPLTYREDVLHGRKACWVATF